MDAPRFPDGVQEVRMSRGDLETDGRTLAGYLSVFDSPATINEHGGQFIERMKPGSFKKTIREGGAEKVKVMFDHGLRDMKLPSGRCRFFARTRLASTSRRASRTSLSTTKP